MLSGGLPHSEIPGSKLILSSPGLIAEYHVLHRLLLPRHPPNALFALDLIQKEQDSRLPTSGWFGQRLSFRSKVIHFPAPYPKTWNIRLNPCGSNHLVSVLDLDKIAVSKPTQIPEANPEDTSCYGSEIIPHMGDQQF